MKTVKGSTLRRVVMAMVVILSAPILLSSCSVRASTVTVEIFPSALSWYTQTRETTYWSWPFGGGNVCDSTGPVLDLTMPEVLVGPGSTMIGYDFTYFENDASWCWKRLTRYARTYVQFDVPSVIDASQAIVTKAVVRFDELPVIRRDDSGTRLSREQVSCIAPGWYEPSRIPGSAADVLAANIEYWPNQTETGWNITGLATGWVAGSAENLGLVIAGQREDVSDSSAACASVLSNVRLVVTYTTFGFGLG